MESLEALNCVLIVGHHLDNKVNIIKNKAKVIPINHDAFTYGELL